MGIIGLFSRRGAAAVALAILTGASAFAADPGLVEPGAIVRKVAGGFAFTEGPAANAEGEVFFSDIPNNKIYRLNSAGEAILVREDSGAANGLAFDKEGFLIACEGGSRMVTSMDGDSNVVPISEKCDGKRFNSPNDLWIDPKGGIYFTDPRYGETKDLEQDGMHVYYIVPGFAKTIRAADGLKRPNGIVGTPDGKKIYVADEGGNATWSYSVKPDGTLTGKTPFAPEGSDGITLDEKGNVYLTNDAVRVYSPEGKKIADIEIPEPPANVGFGGKDRKTLYITARTSVFALKMAVSGQ